jgi:hypothetical protein
MKLCILALAAISVFAESRATHVILSTRTAVTSDKTTVQLDPSNRSKVFPVAAVIQATVAGTVKIEHSGTAATATASTPVVTIPGGAAAKAKGFSNSNVGAGTTASITYELAAGVPFSLDMTTMALLGAGTTKNITVVVALDESGDVQTALYFREE